MTDNQQRPVVPGSCPECGSSVPDWRHFRGCSQDTEVGQMTDGLPGCNLPSCPQPGAHLITVGRCIVVPAVSSQSDNQQRAAEVLGFRELEQAKRCARDDLERIAAALDEAEERGRAEVVAVNQSPACRPPLASEIAKRSDDAMTKCQT